MKITLQSASLEKAPAGFTRVHLAEEEKGMKRLVREGKSEHIEMGIGKRADISRRQFQTLARSIVTTAKTFKKSKIAISFDAFDFPQLADTEEAVVASLIAQNLEIATFEYTKFKSKKGFKVEEVLICKVTTKATREGFTRGKVIGEEVNKTRALANTPGGDMTPQMLAKAAKDAVKGLPVSVKTLSVSEMKKLGMGAILGVGKGSSFPPTFTVMEYKGNAKAPIVLAGKGITFDSGGLNLKPSSSIYEMHMDMSGAAAVIHAVALAARLKLKKHVIALIPAAENMPGNEAYRPGDILTSLSGKTIEVLNTDAEGRLVLADAITYAKRLKPSVVIDVATLTGAAITALGFHANAVMTRDEELGALLAELGEDSGDYSWPLPLWDEYESSIQGTFADISNVASSGGMKGGGAIEGGMFLWQFAKELDAPWAHIDIAPRMTSIPGDELAKGAAGSPVRLLLRFIEEWNR